MIGTHSHGREDEVKPWVILAHQAGQNSSTPESCAQSKVTGCTVCPRQIETLDRVQSPPSESCQEMGAET